MGTVEASVPTLEESEPETERKADVPDSGIALARWYHRQRLCWQTWWHYGRHHAGSIEPFRVLELSPGAIRHALPEPRRRALEAASPPHVQAVERGRWDLETERFLETERYRAVARLVRRASHVEVADDPTRATVTADGGRDEGAGYRNALEWYLTDIATRGAVSITDRRQYRTVTDPTIADPYPHLPAAKGEIRVNVGRDGRCILHSGHERLALASLLGLESVPVHVYVRHEQWQRRRDRVALTGGDMGAHPDLNGLLPG
ncbi:hypothetical protein ACLI4Q_03340 [Natrialbaceae archaeon A-CW1-1]